MRQLEQSFASASGRHLEEVALLAKCLGDVNRLRIVLAVGGGEKPVTRIAEELGISQPLASHHLKELKRARLVRVERRGPFVYYTLADQRLLGILAELEGLAGRLPAGGRFR